MLKQHKNWLKWALSTEIKVDHKIKEVTELIPRIEAELNKRINEFATAL